MVVLSFESWILQANRVKLNGMALTTVSLVVETSHLVYVAGLHVLGGQLIHVARTSGDLDKFLYVEAHVLDEAFSECDERPPLHLVQVLLVGDLLDFLLKPSQVHVFICLLDQSLSE